MKKAELIVALDVPSSTEAGHVVDQLPEAVSFYKVGLELFSAEGPIVLQTLKERNKKVFLDLKLHDIPRTVERAVEAIVKQDVQLLTLHATGGRDMMKAAADAAKGSNLNVIAVTTLTSLSQEDLASVGIQRDVKEQALALADLAMESGVHGLVTSALEVGALRKRVGDDAILVTPGIRLAGGDVGDQKRVATPRNAVEDGASHLVVGRPILQAEHPGEAALAVLKDIEQAV